jgi:hypothetical protein
MEMLCVACRSGAHTSRAVLPRLRSTCSSSRLGIQLHKQFHKQVRSCSEAHPHLNERPPSPPAATANACACARRQHCCHAMHTHVVRSCAGSAVARHTCALAHTCTCCAHLRAARTEHAFRIGPCSRSKAGLTSAAPAGAAAAAPSGPHQPVAVMQRVRNATPRTGRCRSSVPRVASQQRPVTLWPCAAPAGHARTPGRDRVGA